MYGFNDGYAEHNSTPATAARAEPMANVSAMVPFTLIPISCAAPLSSETASMACPAFVFLINRVSPAMITIQETMVTMVSPEMVRLPPARTRAGTGTTDEKDFVFAPKTRSARF